MRVKEAIREIKGNFLAWSMVLLGVALTILMLKSFYPYHRLIAFIVSGLGWALFYFAVRKYGVKKYEENRKSITRWAPFVSSVAGIALTVWVITSLFPVTSFEIAKADKVALAKKMNSDQVYAEKYIEKIRETEKALFEQIDKNSLSALTSEDKAKTRELWRDYLGYFTALDEIAVEYKYFYQINYLTNKALHEQAFMLTYSPFVAYYSSSLNLIKKVESLPLTENLLNEGVPEYGIPKEAYYKIQKKIIDPENILEGAAGWAYMQIVRRQNLAKLKRYSQENYANAVLLAGKSPDIKLHGAADYFEKNVFKGWFPVQKEFSKLAGDTKIPLVSKVFIDAEKIKQIENGLKPGDIFLQRRNWYLSNAGLPGFWKHTVIYIGSLSDLDKEFPPSPATEGLSMGEYIKKNFPALYEEIKDNKKRTLEAESEGIVSFTLDYSMAADYAAVLRPKVSQEEKLKALMYSFAQFGKSYDFDFDFLTDNTLVCSELYYKAYPVIKYNLRTISGRMVLSSNHIVQDFDEKYDEQKNLLELVYFIDADEKTRTSFFGSLDSFRKSWQRSETDVMKAFTGLE